MKIATEHQLALRLHAMHEDDRSWILDQVDDEPRRKLASLLVELKELGLVADENTLEAFAHDADAPDFPSTDTLHKLLDIVDRASADVAFHCLRGEPAAIRRHIISMRSWAWLGELTRNQLAHLQAGASDSAPWRGLAPAAQKALLCALIAQIHEAEQSGMFRHAPHPPRRATVFRRIKDLVQWRA